MFHPNDTVSAAVAVVLVPALIVGIWRHGIVAPPKALAAPEAPSQPSGDLAALAAEAKRDYG
jgi:hypothetical protein